MSSPFEGLEGAVCSAVPLATLTSFHIGGPAEFLIEPRNPEELVRLIGRCVNNDIPLRVLGGGSNLLASDCGVPGAVFRLCRMAGMFRSGATVVCEAGVSLARLVRKAEEWGLSGLEPLAGIPGTVGGAVAMNAGGKYGSIASALCSATSVDRFGFVHKRSREKLGLAYRRSNLHDEIVIDATFDLTEQDPAEITETQAAILDEKARTQPLAAWSAGCIFKNTRERGAGQLIDLAGMKGHRVGPAVVSPKHANFIINEGGATAQDVRALIGKVRTRVHQAFGIDLKLEIEIWN